MENVVSAVLRGESARDTRNLAELMGPDRKIAETMNHEILSMGALIKGEYRFENFRVPRVRARPNVAGSAGHDGCGQTAQEMVSFLAIVVKLSTFEIELVIDAVRRLYDICYRLTLTYVLDGGFGFP